ncbi:7168_t:CDS:2, partial [Scutellospora calospora]
AVLSGFSAFGTNHPTRRAGALMNGCSEPVLGATISHWGFRLEFIASNIRIGRKFSGLVE